MNQRFNHRFAFLIVLICSYFHSQSYAQLSQETKERLSNEIDFTADELILVECGILNEPFYIQIRKDWSPLGAQRFLDIINDGFYDGIALFRAIENFLVQFGIPDNKENDMKSIWRTSSSINDDPKIPINEKFSSKIDFIRGMLSFAGSGPNSRNIQMFFTLVEKTDWLGRELWETPFGIIIDNINILTKINTEYGDNPKQGNIWQQGYKYLQNEFPNLTYMDYCKIIDQNEMEYFNNKLNNNNIQNQIQNIEENNINKDDNVNVNVNGNINDNAVNIDNIDNIDMDNAKYNNGDNIFDNDDNINDDGNINVDVNGDDVDKSDNHDNDLNVNDLREKLRERGKKVKQNNIEIDEEQEFADKFSTGVEILEFIAIFVLIVGIFWAILRIKKGEKQA